MAIFDHPMSQNPYSNQPRNGAPDFLYRTMQRLKSLFDDDGEFEEKRWTFDIVIERLKSIRMSENLIDGVVIKTEISQADEEQQRILDLLGMKLP